jgi:hypothetical protein
MKLKQQWHRSIKRKPSSVNEDNAAEVWHTLYAREKLHDKDVKFKELFAKLDHSNFYSEKTVENITPFIQA